MVTTPGVIDNLQAPEDKKESPYEKLLKDLARLRGEGGTPAPEYTAVQEAEAAMPTGEQVQAGQNQAEMYGGAAQGLSNFVSSMTGGPATDERSQVVGSYRQRLKDQQSALAQLKEKLGGAKKDAMETAEIGLKAAQYDKDPSLEKRTVERDGEKYIQYHPVGQPNNVVHEVNAGKIGVSARPRTMTVRGPQVKRHLRSLGFSEDEVNAIDTTQPHTFQFQGGAPVVYGGVAPKLSVDEEISKGRRTKEEAADVKDEEAVEEAAASKQVMSDFLDRVQQDHAAAEWTGPIFGNATKAASFVGLSTDEKSSRLDAELKKGLMDMIKELSGLTVSDKERLMNQMVFPSVSDTKALFKSKVDAMKNAVEKAYQRRLLTTRKGQAGGMAPPAYNEKQEMGIQNVMKSNGISREKAIQALKKAGKL